MVLTSSEEWRPAVRRFVTSRYLEVAYGSRQGCVDATRSHAGIAHKPSSIQGARITGSTATAVVFPTGGLYDGERITV